MGKKKTWIMLSHRALEAAEPVACVSWDRLGLLTDSIEWLTGVAGRHSASGLSPQVGPPMLGGGQ